MSKKYFINRNWPFRLSYKLIVSVLQVKHERVPSKIIQYRDYKNFNSTRFLRNLSKAY